MPRKTKNLKSPLDVSSIQTKTDNILGLMQRLRDEFDVASDEAVAAAIDSLATREDRSSAERIASLAAMQKRIAAHLQSLAKPRALKKPPALWKERLNRSETPIEFIRREYAEYIGHGLTRTDLRKDPSLYYALRDWLQTNKMPEDLDLPTRKQHNDALLTAVSPGWPDEMQRLQELARHRKRRAARKPQ